jgi:hypothetical protein
VVQSGKKRVQAASLTLLGRSYPLLRPKSVVSRAKRPGVNFAQERKGKEREKSLDSSCYVSR